MVLYPNPVQDRLTLHLSDPAATGTVLISVYDATGKLVRAVQETLNLGVTTTTLDVSALPKGIYLVQATGAITGNSRLVVE